MRGQSEDHVAVAWRDVTVEWCARNDRESARSVVCAGVRNPIGPLLSSAFDTSVAQRLTIVPHRNVSIFLM